MKPVTHTQIHRLTRTDSRFTYFTVLRKTCPSSAQNSDWQKCDTTGFSGRSVSSLRLLQLSLICFLGAAPFPCLTSPSPPVLLPVFLLSLLTFLSFCVHPVVPALSLLLSDKLFVGRNLRHSLLSCSQVLSLFVSVPLYLSKGHGQSPPLSLSLGVTISSPPWLSQELTLSHQNTNTTRSTQTKCCFTFTQLFKTLYTPDNPPTPLQGNHAPSSVSRCLWWRTPPTHPPHLFKEGQQTLLLAVLLQGGHAYRDELGLTLTDCHVKVMDLIRRSVSRYQKWSVTLNNKGLMAGVHSLSIPYVTFIE